MNLLEEVTKFVTGNLFFIVEYDIGAELDRWAIMHFKKDILIIVSHRFVSWQRSIKKMESTNPPPLSKITSKSADETIGKIIYDM